MRPTATFLDLVRSIDSGNAPTRIEQLAALLTAEPPSGSRASATLRHLEALGFRLEGGARFGDAARAYELAAAIDPHDPSRWRRIAIVARLRDFIAAGLVLFILTFIVNAIARIVIERRKAFTE